MSTRIFVPRDTAACALGADDIAEFISSLAGERGLAIELVRNGSRGAAWLEPLVEIEHEGARLAYGSVLLSDVSALLDCLEGTPRDHPKYLGPISDIPWLSRQQRVTFVRAGEADPLCLDSYRRLGGYKGLERALGMPAEAVVAEVIESGLRGRGGAAFPAGIKWRTVLEAEAGQKYVVCNADEGDSGTFADRLLMEADPFQLFEARLRPTGSSIFIPSREVLAMYEGFIGAYQHSRLSFSEVYYDTCVALNAPLSRGALTIHGTYVHVSD